MDTLEDRHSRMQVSQKSNYRFIGEFYCLKQSFFQRLKIGIEIIIITFCSDFLLIIKITVAIFKPQINFLNSY